MCIRDRVCALSVLNGFVGLVSSMLDNFDPELKIQPVHGKVFDPTLPAVREVKVLPEVALFCEVLQDNAQVRYRDRQITAMVKGVDDTFGRLTVSYTHLILLPGYFAGAVGRLL